MCESRKIFRSIINVIFQAAECYKRALKKATNKIQICECNFYISKCYFFAVYNKYVKNEKEMHAKRIPHLKAAFETAYSDRRRWECSSYMLETYTRIVY